MLKTMLTLAVFFILTTAAKAQSSLQIVGENKATEYVTLQNPNQYFEESGDNISIANLAAGTYNLSISNSLDANAFKKQITIDLQPNQRTILRVGSNMNIDKSVVALTTNNTVIVNNTPAANNSLHRIKKEDFANLLSSVQRAAFDDNKIQLIAPAVKYAALTSEQISQLLSSMRFDDNRLKYAKILFANTTDKENYNKVCNAFTFSGYCEQLMQFLKTQ